MCQGVAILGLGGAGSYVIHIVHKPFLGAQFGTEGSNLNTPSVGGGRVGPEFYTQSPAPSASPRTDSPLLHMVTAAARTDSSLGATGNCKPVA